MARQQTHSERSPLLWHRQDARASNEDPAAEVGVKSDPSNVELCVALCSVWMARFVSALDTTITTTLSGPIASSFGSLSLLSWIASAYLVANAAFQPLTGKLTDLYSRRAGLVVCNVFFGVGNLICGLATEQWMMILGRAVAGIGGGGLLALATQVTADLVPLRRRGIWQGLSNIWFGLGLGLGGAVGGLFNDWVGWRWAFLAQVPVSAIAGVTSYFTVNIPVKNSGGKSRIKRVDFLGAFTLVAALISLLLGLNTGGNQLPWSHPFILAILPISLVLLGIFIYVEANVVQEPIIPVRLMLNSTIMSACFIHWFTNMAAFGLYVYIPIYFQIQGFSATKTGILIIPNAIGTAVGSLGVGLLMKRTGGYLIHTYVSTGLYAASFIATYFAVAHSAPVWVIMTILFAEGIAYGSLLNTTTVAMNSSIEQDKQAVITSASYAFRSTGSSIGIAISSAVFQNFLTSGLWKSLGDLPGAAKWVDKVRDNLDEIHHLPKEYVQGAIDAYMASLESVFITLAVLATLVFLLSVGIKKHVLHNSLDRTDSRR